MFETLASTWLLFEKQQHHLAELTETIFFTWIKNTSHRRILMRNIWTNWPIISLLLWVGPQSEKSWILIFEIINRIKSDSKKTPPTVDDSVRVRLAGQQVSHSKMSLRSPSWVAIQHIYIFKKPSADVTKIVSIARKRTNVLRKTFKNKKIDKQVEASFSINYILTSWNSNRVHPFYVKILLIWDFFKDKDHSDINGTAVNHMD